MRVMRPAIAWFTLIGVLLFLALALYFAVVQTIWTDETTQLSGVSLGPVELTRWLAGNDPDRFNVPADRMPPLGYYSQWLWAQLTGSEIFGLRVQGIIFVALAIVIVSVAVRPLGGGLAVAIALCYAALSPNWITNAVEIRAYPLLILLSSIGFASLLQYVSTEEARSRRRWGVLMLLSGVLATYTHFFGGVAMAAQASAALGHDWFVRRERGPGLVMSVVAGLCCLGVMPFVLSAMTISGTEGAADAGISALAGDVVRWFYRFFGNPVLSVDRIPLVVGLLSWSLLLTFACYAAVRLRDKRSLAILSTLCAGSLLTLAISFIAEGMDAFKVSYSTWMLPGWALLLGSSASLVKLGKAWSRVLLLVFPTFLVANLWVAGTFARHAGLFVHGPHEGVLAFLENSGEVDLPILHESEGPWGLTYFPLVYEFGEARPQYVAEVANGEVSLEMLIGGREVSSISDLDANQLLVLSARNFGHREIKEWIDGERTAVDSGEVQAFLSSSENWELIEDQHLPAYVAARLMVFARTR